MSRRSPQEGGGFAGKTTGRVYLPEVAHFPGVGRGEWRWRGQGRRWATGGGRMEGGEGNPAVQPASSVMY
eukprot:944980-Rhodomonas_salina.5